MWNLLIFQHNLRVALPVSSVERTLYFMSSEQFFFWQILHVKSHNTEASSHTSSAGKGGMLNLGLVKKAIFSLQTKNTIKCFLHASCRVVVKWKLHKKRSVSLYRSPAADRDHFITTTLLKDRTLFFFYHVNLLVWAWCI